MASRSSLPWTEILALPVVAMTERVLERRFRVGLGHTDDVAATTETPFEQPCQVAGLTEIVAPIAAAGEIVGALTAGTFIANDGAKPDGEPPTGPRAARQPPRLGADQRATIAALVAEAASAAAAHLSGRPAAPRSASDRVPAYTARYAYDALVGRGHAMQALYRLLDRVIDSDATVLITGENGTGKELVARAIHQHSDRKGRRFVVQNCSAFNDNLLDSELFGHKRGAFTGAVADKPGLFEVADRGTFFLDEIGDMSPALQVKVLRVLQEGTFTPVGDTDAKQVDVRIIAATNRDLKRMVELGQFREDLYYRIHVINLVMPALRERRDDIPVLVEHFLTKHARGRKVKTLADACLARLMTYPWPGNVRELENELERLIVLAGDDRVIDAAVLSPRIRDDGTRPVPAIARSLPAAIDQLERSMISEALGHHGGNKTRAAETLGISRRNLIRLAQKYELD